MAVIPVLACDVCRAQPATTWRVTEAGDTEYRIDLCKECAKPLRSLRRSGRKQDAPASKHRRAGIVKTIDYGDR